MNDPTSSPNNVHNLRKVLNVMFPQTYIQLYHRPPHSVCSLFSLKWNQLPTPGEKVDESAPTEWGFRFEASSEPSSRGQIMKLSERLNSSLVDHQAKPVGLCPIRRAIYDQCFDELIRQVTVGCIEQGLLLFRIRNELRATLAAFRRAHESGVKFGLNKAIRAELELEQERAKIEQLESEVKLKYANSSMVDNLNHIELANKLDAYDKVKAYYETELARKEQVINQQRNVIETLTKRYTNDIKSTVASEEDKL